MASAPWAPLHVLAASLLIQGPAVLLGQQQKMAQVLGLLPPRGPALAVAATCGVNVPVEQLSLSCPHPLPVTLPFE